MSDAPKHPKSRSKVYPAVVRRDLRKYGIHIPHEMGGKGATWSFPSTEPQHTSFVCSCWSHDLLGPKGSRPFAISAERAAGQWRLCWCLQAGAMVCHGGKGRGSSHWYDWVDGLFSDKHHLHNMQGFEILVSQQRKLNVGRSWLWTMEKKWKTCSQVRAIGCWWSRGGILCSQGSGSANLARCSDAFSLQGWQVIRLELLNAMLN